MRHTTDFSPTPPMPDLHAAEPIPDAARTALAGLFETGDLFRYTTPGAPAAKLEQEFAAHVGSRYALAVSSCSAALFLALEALALPPRARVLIPAFTFAAVPSAVVHAGCAPVLVEVDDTLRLDLGDLAAKATDADAILISHMRGHTSDMDAIRAIAARHDLPVIEDAAHSLGTTWDGETIGTLGRIGCFSFQSYKMLNAGEGGMLVTDDADLAARAIIMSGAYEANWRKHPGIGEACARWQNRLPLYNTRLSNLAASVVRPQIPLIARRVANGRRNHDRVATALEASGLFAVPRPLAKERRAPDSIQFSLTTPLRADARAFVAGAAARGVPVQVFGESAGNARAFWNWEFLGAAPDLPKTRAMLARTCDMRLPARLTEAECDLIAVALVDAARETLRSAA